ncbi:ras guanine nucleotide exchange factor domain-containing protein [Catenaria anguillulae PL171]|uniref:Ras guanine nucleotide exchange factor domain-containing protein n=1 Tax=Catenaria anguillulae PL171 TaxID=765915 RepID=A0A1Y2HKE2_9FUNG|nr:ras guanine nucleotide exchange factor domain-containing protein [Catenaria anguillulae PL171]
MVLVVRALYSYEGDHDSSLTFQADDLIQVFTQLESGWWDGLLREDRGWFPSNYVSPPLIMRSRAEEKAWTRRTAADGQPFWYNEATGESAWDRKDNVILLPEGWTIQDTEDGQGQFFFHEETDEVSWTLPPKMWEAGYARAAMVAPPPLSSGDAPAAGAAAAADGEANGTATASSSTTASAPAVTTTVEQSKTNSLDATSALRRGSGARTPTPAMGENARSSAHTNGSSTDARPSSSSTAPGTPPTTTSSFANGTDSSTPAPAPGNPLGSPTPSMGAASIASASAGPAERQMQAWSLLTQQIFAAIQRLLKSAKTGNKQAFIPNSSQIVDAIRAMLQASGAVDKESAAVKSNPPVKQQHRALLGALSKLVLSAKLASGVWPPPDAVQKMIGDSSELLSSVRGFVEVARQCNVEVKTDIIEQKAKEENERAAEQSAAAASQAAPAAEPSSTPSVTSPTSNGPNRALSISLDSNTINQLDTLSSSVLETLSRLYATTQEHITVVTLVTLTRSAVTEVGQFLSFIEDIHLEEGPDSPLLHEFKIHKQSLYNNIAGLVMATSTATENLAPPNAMDQVVLSITVVERSVKDLLASTQQLLEAKYRREFRRSSMAAPAIPLSPVSPFPQQKPIAADRLQLNTELANSAAQRRAQSGPMSAYTQGGGLMSPPHTTASFASAPAGAGGRIGSLGSSPPQTPYSAKLRKFFGDDVDPSTLPPIPQGPRGMSGEMDPDANAWFLGYDYAPNEIMFNMESQVKGGTLRALIERLTLHDQFDAEYMTAFLFSYRTFIPSTALVDSLMARFSIAPPEGLTDSELETWIEKKMTPVRLRVFNVMKMWVEHYCLPYIPDDLLALEQMAAWARSVMRPVMAPASVQLTKLIEKRQTYDKPHLPLRNVPPINGMTHVQPAGPPPSPLLPKSLKKLKFTDLDPLEVARQLTLIEYSYFTRLIYTEFLMKSWSADRGSAEEAKARAPNLRRMVEMSNSITGWVAESILAEEDPKKRCSLLKHYIQIADKCRALNNYNTLFSILAALNSAPIHRLARTWEMLSTKTLGVLNDLRQITDPTKNFATYRELVASVQPPCIPFLGRYLSDLTFLEDGNPNVLKIPGQPAPGEDGASPDAPVLVNFSKRAKTADIIREIQQFQVLPFHLKPVTEVQEYLLGMINHNRESGELYEISLNREPREREDQKLVRLLSESGLL